MVGIKSAQENLFRLAAALVLAYDDAGNDAQDFLRIVYAAHFYIQLADRPVLLAGRAGNGYGI